MVRDVIRDESLNSGTNEIAIISECMSKLPEKCIPLVKITKVISANFSVFLW